MIGSALAGIAGVMVGMYYIQIKTSMGFIPGIKAFTAAVLGGIGSIPGAMLGAYILGLAEVIGVQFLPAVYKDVVAFSLLVLTLLFKPTRWACRITRRARTPNTATSVSRNCHYIIHRGAAEGVDRSRRRRVSRFVFTSCRSLR